MIWLLDSGLFDLAVWRTIWDQHEHVVSRIYHTEHKVAFQDRQRHWQEGDIAQARAELRSMARVETTLEIKRGKQVSPNKQPVQVGLSACPLRVTYWTNVRCQRPGRPVTRDVWLEEVRVLGTDWEPWLLLTDWPMQDAASATRIFQMYRQRALSGGQFQISQNVSGLGRPASARLVVHSDVRRSGLGRCGLSP